VQNVKKWEESERYCGMLSDKSSVHLGAQQQCGLADNLNASTLRQVN